MKFGVFSNGQRIKDPSKSYDDDIDEIVVADKAGFEEVWMSEHTGQPWLPFGVPSTELLFAKAAALTSRIRFGPAVRRVALYPPQMVAIEGAVLDHLTHGRYMLGFGVGPPVTNYRHWGIDSADGEARTIEAIDLIRRCWSETEPFDFQGRFFRGEGIDIYPKPHQPRIPVAVATSRRRLLDMAAQNGFRVLTTWTATADSLRKIGETFDAACLAVDGATRRRDIIATRAIHVAATDAQAMAEVETDWRAHIAHSQKHLEPATAGLHLPGGGRSGRAFCDLIDNGNIITGSPDTIVQAVREFYADIGGFGTLLVVVGRDVGDNAQRARMLQLFMKEVAPRLADLDVQRDAAPARQDIRAQSATRTADRALKSSRSPGRRASGR